MGRSAAREDAFKVLFQHEINKNDSYIKEKRHPYAEMLIHGVLDNLTTIDEQIRSSLKNWSFNRVALVEKTILRIAAYELLFLDDIPIGVAINEAIELAHTYGDEKSSKFVNGVLSNIAKQEEE